MGWITDALYAMGDEGRPLSDFTPAQQNIIRRVIDHCQKHYQERLRQEDISWGEKVDITCSMWKEARAMLHLEAALIGESEEG